MHREWAPTALLVSAARKVSAELGATVRWGSTLARLEVPALETIGDPRAVQLAQLGTHASDDFFAELSRVAPDEAHVAVLFAEADPSAIAARLGDKYVLAESMPLMTRDIPPETRPTSVPVESAIEADRDRLTELDERSAIYRFDVPGLTNLVVRDGGRVVGKGQLVEAMPGIGYLTDMVVHSDYRRRGLGRAIVLRAETLAAAGGGHTMLLASTDMGRDLYGSLGYDVTCWLHSFASV